MAQVKTFSWTNSNPAVARNLNVGFQVTKITTIDKTNGGSWEWVYGMDDGSSLDVDAGTISGSNGFTPLTQSAQIGGTITNISAAASAVITVTNTSQFDFLSAGDVISVTGVADDQTGTTLNGNYTISSVSGNSITTSTNTSSGYSAYVSGGVAIPATSEGDATRNFAIQGITVGTTPVGAASAEMVAIVEGQNPVT